MKRTLGWIVVLAGFLAGLFALPRLPGVVVRDFSSRIPFGTLSLAVDRIWVALALPSAALIVWLLIRADQSSGFGRRLQRWLPSRLRTDSSPPEQAAWHRDTMEMVGLVVVIVFIAIHAAGLAAALGGPTSIRTVPALIGLALIVGGNSAPRLRRNLIAGIRTRATLEDPVVWARVHRLLGKFLVGSGVLTLATVLVAGRHGLTVAAFGLLGSVVAACLIELRRRPPPLSSGSSTQ